MNISPTNAARGPIEESARLFLAFATAKSFGDFVIAHSVLHRVNASAKHRLRLIANSHVRGLNAILPEDVCVTLVDSDSDRVPALFDIKKRGAIAAVQSAVSLRKEFQKIPRRDSEALIFAGYGLRERFIAGDWPVFAPRRMGRNIYETYFHLLAEHGISLAWPTAPTSSGKLKSLGIFPESRLESKRLNDTTVSMIADRAAARGLHVEVFVLDGDTAAESLPQPLTRIRRDFKSLAVAIKSVDCVLSADSLPAHLAEYFARPTFVALPAPNEHWMPLGCFTEKRWAVFGERTEFSAAIDRFFDTATTSRPIGSMP